MAEVENEDIAPSASLPFEGVRLFGVAAIVVVLILASAGFSVQTSRATDRGEEAIADDIANTLTTSMGNAVDDLSTVQTLVDDGVIEYKQFAEVAGPFIAEPSFSAAALAVVVTAEQRPAIEAELGVGITERGSDNPFIPAADRPSYAAVLAVAPETDTTIQLLGFDVAADPVRGPALVEAERTRAPAATEPVALQPLGTPGVIVAYPLFSMALGDADNADNPVVGYAVSVHDAQDLLNTNDISRAGGARVRVRDAESILIETDLPPESPTTAQIPIVNQVWTIEVDSGKATNQWRTYTLLLLTAAIIVGATGMNTASRRRLR